MTVTDKFIEKAKEVIKGKKASTKNKKEDIVEETPIEIEEDDKTESGLLTEDE